MEKYKHYRILKSLKKNKELSVFKIYCPSSKKYYVLKLIKKDKNVPNSKYLPDISHPNVIQCIKIDEVKYNNKLHHLYILEWADGGNLRLQFNKTNSLFHEHIIQFLKALNYLHKRNIIHGDIKPENILFAINNNKPFLKLSDYNTKIQQGVFAITPEYVAPEYKIGLNVKTDIWSIGCLLYESFLHKLPFGSRKDGFTTEQILENQKYQPIPKQFLKIPEPYKYIIFKCLQKNTKHRFQNIDIILKKLLNPPHFLTNVKHTFEYVNSIRKGEIK